MLNLREIIEQAYANIKTVAPIDTDLKQAVDTVIDTLDCGGIRVAEHVGGSWMVNDWVKKAIILSARLNHNKLTDAAWTKFYDKVDLKFRTYTEDMFKHEELRVVPHALVRKGAFIGKNTLLMPSYVNVGAHIGDHSIIDTWATIGSCAQIGNNVHISTGVSIGGVLEPLHANPTIIENNCFIGAKSDISEGVIVEEGSVLSMGVYLSQATRIYNRQSKTISYGRIPPYSVVVPGNIPSACKSYSMYAAIIVKQVDAGTRTKLSINELLCC